MKPTVLSLSEPIPVDLRLYRGDTGQFRVKVTDSDDASVDVSTATWDCDVRKALDDTNAIASFQVTPVPGESSSVDVTITPEVSLLMEDGFFWDLQMTLDGYVKTLMGGFIEITSDVSR